MVVVAQLVRVSVCGTEGRGFEPHLPPIIMKASLVEAFVFLAICIGTSVDEPLAVKMLTKASAPHLPPLEFEEAISKRS